MPSDYSLEYRMGAKPDPATGDIMLAISSRYRDISTDLGTWIIRTKDALTREALITLGWTPPPEK